MVTVGVYLGTQSCVSYCRSESRLNFRREGISILRWWLHP